MNITYELIVAKLLTSPDPEAKTVAENLAGAMYDAMKVLGATKEGQTKEKYVSTVSKLFGKSLDEQWGIVLDHNKETK